MIDDRDAVVTELYPCDPDVSRYAFRQRGRYERAHQYPMTDHLNPHYAVYSDANADRAYSWHQKNGCEVGVCATMTAAVIRLRNVWWRQ
ncbi:hypothetical protein [Nocardia sp. CA-119907]|uniref:hypothetical protein n=1 Tax=Nocardia sp. CA-119907 TaxID=3239973 RepID=UPI003D99ED07